MSTIEIPGVGEATCNASDAICDMICGGKLVSCLIAALIASATSFLTCLNDEFNP